MESIKGISLHYYKYSKSSVIAKFFTENYGLQSYVVRGSRNKSSKNKFSWNKSSLGLFFMVEIFRTSELSFLILFLDRFLKIFLLLFSGLVSFSNCLRISLESSFKYSEYDLMNNLISMVIFQLN